MKSSCTRRKQIACVCLQILLIIVCVSSILVMDLWEIGQAALPADVPASSDELEYQDPMPTPLPNEDTTPYNGSTIVDSGQHVIPVVKETPPLVGTGENLQNRVQSLLSHSDALRDGAVDYGAFKARDVHWDTADIRLGYDEMAFLFLQVFVATTPKAKTCYYRSCSIKSVAEDRVEMQLVADFVLTNKVLALLYGSNSQQITLDFAVVRQNGVCHLDTLEITGNKRINGNLLALGSDILFGTSDYFGYMDKLLSTVITHIGQVRAFEKEGLRFVAHVA